jgi:hypothetical protein
MRLIFLLLMGFIIGLVVRYKFMPSICESVCQKKGLHFYHAVDYALTVRCECR